MRISDWSSDVCSSDLKLRTGDPVDVDYRLRLSDGGYSWMRSRASARRDAKGRIVRWYGTLEDIHAQKLAQRELANSEERFRLAVQSRSEEHTSELQSLMRISYAVFCLKKKKIQ